MKKIYLTILALSIAVTCSKAQWITTGTNISNTNLGNVGIGTNNPNAKLDVYGDGTFAGSLQIGNAEVNSNTTKLFINNGFPNGKK